MFILNVNVSQVKTVTAQAVASDLTPGLLWGGATPAWAAQSNSGLTITPAADGFSATVVGSKPGTFSVTVSSQDPTGAPVVGTFSVVVNQENATTFLFSSN